MKKFYLLALLPFFISCQCNQKKQTAPSQDAKFDKFKNSFLEALWQKNPSWATSVGYHKYDSILEIPSAENLESQQRMETAWRDSLMQFDIQSLSPNNKTDYYLLENYFVSSRWYFDTLKNYSWDPSIYNVGDAFDKIITRTDISLAERLHLVDKRLNAIASYYAAAKLNIVNPTLEHTQFAIDQNKGALDVFDHEIVDSLAYSLLTAEEKKNLNRKLIRADSSIIDYVRFLETTREELKKNGTARSFRIGKDLFARKFQLDLQSQYSADSIYHVAIRRKDEVQEKMMALSRKLWPKYFGSKPIPDGIALVKKVIDTISVQHSKPDSFIADIQKLIPALTNFITKKKLLDLDPAKPLIVRAMPAYAAGFSGMNMDAPGPYDPARSAYYNVTPLTGKPVAQTESWLREYNTYIIQLLSIHEALPGHYVQLLYNNKSPDIVKSIFGDGATVEGWAVYCEQMMMEEGYGDQSDELWLMFYKWHLRAVMNTILDYQAHCLNMSKEDAISLMINEGFQMQAEAEGKWRRMTLSQVQLCSYFTGYSEIYELREDLKKKEGDQFNLKEFHEQFLSFGSAPVKYIREAMIVDK